MEKIEFNTGGVWEGSGFEIHKDHVEDDNYYVPCKHAHSKKEVTKAYYSGTEYQVTEYTIPFVAVQINEGGFCTTGTCAECIAEAIQILIK